MDVEDLSQNLRIANLKKLTRELEQSQTPDQTLQALRRSFAQTYGFVTSLLLSTQGLPLGQYRIVQLRLKDEPLQDVFVDAPAESVPVQSGGVMGAIISRPEPQLIQEVDWASDLFFHETLKGYASLMAIPFVGDHLPINWTILLKQPPERFTTVDLEEAMQRLTLVGSLLVNQALAGRLALAHERIDRDARQVGELQRALLPKALPEIAGLEIAVSYEPSGRAGGDLYDFLPLDGNNKGLGLDDSGMPGRWCVFIGDAAGHGLAAAVVIAIVQAVLHAHPKGIVTPASLLMHANHHLCRKNIGGFVTAFLGIYEPTTRQLTFANAGHPPPLLRHSSDGTISTLDALASFPLGIDASETFEEEIVQLAPGDTVLLYTDGITEARGNAEDFEQDRLIRVFRDGGEQPAELIEVLRRAVKSHEHGQPAKDDQTIVAARAL